MARLPHNRLSFVVVHSRALHHRGRIAAAKPRRRCSRSSGFSSDGGSTPRLTSVPLVSSASRGPVERAMLVVLVVGWGWTGGCRMESASCPKPDAPAAHAPTKAWSGAEEGEDGQHAAVLIGRLGEAELPEDLGHVSFDGALGDVQPGGDGPVGHAFGDQSEHLSFPLAEEGEP